MPLQQVLRVSICVCKKPEWSDKDFHKYWAESHGPLVREFLVKNGVLKYNQYHITEEHKAMGQGIGMSTPYDGFAEFWVRDHDHFVSLFKDPHYFAVIKPDEDKFGDNSKAVYNVGVDYVVVEDNKIVEHPEGSPF